MRKRKKKLDQTWANAVERKGVGIEFTVEPSMYPKRFLCSWNGRPFGPESCYIHDTAIRIEKAIDEYY